MRTGSAKHIITAIGRLARRGVTGRSVLGAMSMYLLLAPFAALHAQDLRALLLNELQTTHDKEEWFVPVQIALSDLTPAQASWSHDTANHSIGQLANHLLFWNRRQLQKLKGEKADAFDGDNNETFNNFNAKNWAATTRDLNSVLTELEAFVKGADETRLRAIASTISHIATHNAYHTGQIILIRKEQGWWDPSKGVK
jgi:uncharacterized damage-inducible protein DinB